jgi:6-pyruvoyltetrahydropterin/6-carboxytetrahydropterin synthase
MTTSITKRFTFEAAHSIPHHTGKCRNLHGHSYVLEVTVSGAVQSSGGEEGMVMDFAHISSIVNAEIIDQWDHQYLNDILPFSTTAEHLAEEVYNRLITAGLPVSRVRLYETAKCWVDISTH